MRVRRNFSEGGKSEKWGIKKPKTLDLKPETLKPIT